MCSATCHGQKRYSGHLRQRHSSGNPSYCEDGNIDPPQLVAQCHQALAVAAVDDDDHVDDDHVDDDDDDDDDDGVSGGGAAAGSAGGCGSS